MKHRIVCFLLALALLMGIVPTSLAAGKPIEVNFVFNGEATDRMTEYTDTVLKPYLLEHYNIDFNIEFLPWSEYGGGQIELRLANGEEFACYADTNCLGKWYTKGYVQDMTDVVAQYGPNIIEHVGDVSFDVFSINDRLYGIPIGNKPNSGEWYNITVRQDLLEEVGMTEITSIEDLEKFYTLCHELHPELLGLGDGGSTALIGPAKYLFYAVTDKNIEWLDDYVFLDNNEEKPVLRSWLESEEFKAVSEILARWQELGIITRDFIVDPTAAETKFNAGLGMFIHGNAERAYSCYNTISSIIPDVKLKTYNLGGLTDTTLRLNRGSYSTVLAVSTEVKHPEAYVQVVDFIYSSQEAYDMWQYGVEGTDYTLDENGRLATRPSNAVVTDEWVFDCVDYKRFDINMTDYYLADYLVWDDYSTARKDIGFIFDSTPVQAEQAQLSAVAAEYFTPILVGLNDYETYYPEALAKLKAAGIDTYLAEYQRQWNEFLAGK